MYINESKGYSPRVLIKSKQMLDISRRDIKEYGKKDESKRKKILESSHVDHSMSKIHKYSTQIPKSKLIQIYQMKVEQYNQINFNQPLLKGIEMQNERYCFLKNISKQYTRRLSQKQEKVYNSQQTKIELTHREKMQFIQNTSPVKMFPEVTQQKRRSIQAPLRSLLYTNQMLENHNILEIQNSLDTIQRSQDYYY